MPGWLSLAALLSLPRANITDIDNDITSWFSREDSVYKDYERFRKEGRMGSAADLWEAVHDGAVMRIRPKAMTVASTFEPSKGAHKAELTAIDIRGLRDRLTPHLVALAEAALLAGDSVKTSADFASALLEKEHVAVTAGEGFDAPGYLRISYAASMEELERGASRIIAHVRAVEKKRATV